MQAKKDSTVRDHVNGNTSGLYNELLKGGSEEDMAAQDAAARKEEAAVRQKHSFKTTLRRIPQVNLREEAQSIESIRQQCVVYLWAVLFGKQRALDMADKFKMQVPDSMKNQQSPTVFQNTGESMEVAPAYEKEADSLNAQDTMENTTTILSPDGREILVTGQRGNAFFAQRETYYSETEETSFSTRGTVKTADGREISFNLNLNMSRSFTSYTRETASSMAAFIDPLVINLNGNIARVTDQQFSFDLDADGEEERIARLSEDSGYLALDLNNDGTINDGSELFGTKSGDGFADLAQYDKDKNGWIDENDEVFNRLKIWVQKEDGSSELLSLRESGVGALCLQNTATEFGQRDSNGQVSAAIRSTGIFLYENGMAGTLQHLDLAQHRIAQYA